MPPFSHSECDAPIDSSHPQRQSVGSPGGVIYCPNRKGECMAQKESKTHAPKFEFYANNHVVRILGRLGLHSRAQIAAWVTERRSPSSDR
jgi:hypothetical protein